MRIVTDAAAVREKIELAPLICLQTQAVKALCISQSRVSDLIRGKWDKFSLDVLITLATGRGRRSS
jgi:predicted XRE-type DNA-binding protein